MNETARLSQNAMIEVIDAKEETPSPTCNHDNAEIYQFVFFFEKKKKKQLSVERHMVGLSHLIPSNSTSGGNHFDLMSVCNCVVNSKL